MTSYSLYPQTDVPYYRGQSGKVVEDYFYLLLDDHRGVVTFQFFSSYEIQRRLVGLSGRAYVDIFLDR